VSSRIIVVVDPVLQPFGDDQTQQSILQNQVILNAVQVPFPDKPKISDEAKVSQA